MGTSMVLKWETGLASFELFSLRCLTILVCRLRLVCTSEGSYPAANIKFYINDEIANDRNVDTVKTYSQYQGVLRTSKKELDIILERRHFRYGDLSIKCTSDIYDIYFQSSKLTFTGLGQCTQMTKFPLGSIKWFI